MLLISPKVSHGVESCHGNTVDTHSGWNTGRAWLLTVVEDGLAVLFMLPVGFGVLFIAIIENKY